MNIDVLQQEEYFYREMIQNRCECVYVLAMANDQL